MAAGILSAPDTPYGPCSTPCNHKDCNETRRMANSECVVCGKPIGYDTRFYVASVGQINEYQHAACLEAKEARQ